MARRKPNTVARLIGTRSAGGNWIWATYQYDGCDHTTDTLYPPASILGNVRQPPKVRKLYHSHEDE